MCLLRLEGGEREPEAGLAEGGLEVEGVAFAEPGGPVVPGEVCCAGEEAEHEEGGHEQVER